MYLRCKCEKALFPESVLYLASTPYSVYLWVAVVHYCSASAPPNSPAPHSLYVHYSVRTPYWHLNLASTPLGKLPSFLFSLM